MNGITVCVEYDDLLAITLPRNARFFEKVVVVTSPTDSRTAAVVAGVKNAVLHQTDAFYRDDARFNKGRAIEEAFDVVGRAGWLLHWDADVLMPDVMPGLESLPRDCLYNPPRRMLEKPADWKPDLDWKTLPLKHEPNEFPGYFQLFHAEAPQLATLPWYATHWKHAGGSDSDFKKKFDGKLRHLPFEVLHIGPDGVNWHGRVTERIDGAPVRDAARNLAEQQSMLRSRKEHHVKGKPWTGK